MRKLILLLLIIFLLPVKAFAIESVISPWAIIDVLDSEKAGILPPLDVESFKDPLEKDVLNVLVTLTAEKVDGYNLPVNKDFKELQSFSSSTREEVLIELFNIFGKYEEEDIPSYLEYLIAKGILKGDGVDYKLNSRVTIEEAVVFFNRALIEFAEDKNVASSGFLWSISHEDKTLYIMGSIHSGSPDLYPLSSEILKAYYSSDTLYVESIVDSAQVDILGDMETLDKGQLINSYLSPDQFSSLQSLMESKDIAEDVYIDLEPWALNRIVSDFGTISSFFGIENYLLERSPLVDISVGGLIDTKVQFETLAAFPKDIYVNMIDDILKNYETRKAESELRDNKMLESWISGDAEAFISALEGDKSRFSKHILNSRKDLFIREIEAILKSDETEDVFIVLGAGHVLGEDNIIDILRDKGYKVRRIVD